MEESSASTLYLDRPRQLCVETCKAINGLAPNSVSDIFQRKDMYYVLMAYVTQTPCHFTNSKA